MTTLLENENMLPPQARDGDDDGGHGTRRLPRPYGLVHPDSKREVLVTLDSSDDSEKTIEYGIALAKISSAQVVLLYVTPRIEVPDSFLEFARKERIPDVQVSYYEGLASDKIARLRRMVEREGLRWRSMTYVGKLVDAMRAVATNGNVALVVMSAPKATSAIGFPLSSGIDLARILRLNVPVLMVPKPVDDREATERRQRQRAFLADEIFDFPWM